MAKKKKAEANDATTETVVESDLEKKYGAGAFISAEDFINEKTTKDIISVSPKLDIILGGGIPEGSTVILAGAPKCGKTVLSLNIAAKAQKLGRKVVYCNVEGRIKPRDLQGIPGLDLKNFEIIRSYKDEETGQSRILMAHEYLEIAERRINEHPGSVVIIDSASQLLSEGEKTGEIGQQHRAPIAVLLSQFCKRIGNVIPVNGNIVIFIVHVVANTGGGMKKTSRTGGNKIQYQVDVDLECMYTERWVVGKKADDEESGTEIGKKVHWKTASTAIAPPGMKTTSYMRYGAGIDEAYEVYDLSKTLGLVTRSGAWYKCAFLDGIGEYSFEADNIPKYQGEENLMLGFSEHPEWTEILKEKLKEYLG